MTSDTVFCHGSKILILSNSSIQNCLIMMKRPSNVILAFTMTIASSILIWIGYLFVFQATESLKPELDEFYESQLEKTRNIGSES